MRLLANRVPSSTRALDENSVVILSRSEGSLLTRPPSDPRRDPSLRLRMTTGVVLSLSHLHVLLAIVVAVSLALVAVPGVSAQDVYSEKTLEISRKLQCPVCAGQSVADSGSQLAGQMRAIIEEKVQAGESEEQIIDFFVARYGASIMTDPPKSGFTLGLWWMPVVVVVLGAAVVGVFIRERTRHGTVSPLAVSGAAGAGEDEELEAIAREVLGASDAEGMSGA